MENKRTELAGRMERALAEDDAPESLRLERAARQLAERHSAVDKRGRDSYPLMSKVANYGQVVRRAYQHYREASEDVLAVSHAAEWLLDNYYLVERAFRQIRDDMPEGYYRLLPVLDGAESGGQPRVYAMARALAYHTDGVLDLDVIRTWVEAYQSVASLSTGELWAIPVMLRIVCLENAAAAVARLTGMDEWNGSEPPTSVLDGKVDDDAVVGHSIHSLRVLAALDWKKLLESVSLVERVLRRDPADVYHRMDFDTRDRYRQVVERLARATDRNEEDVAQTAVWLARRAAGPSAGAPGTSEARPRARRPAPAARLGEAFPRQAHVGYYLVDVGRAELEDQLGYHPGGLTRLGRWLVAHPTPVYLGGISLLVLALVVGASLYAASAGAGAGIVALVALLSLVPAATLAVDAVNWIVTHTTPPRVLPKLDFERGIPSRYHAIVSIPSMLTGPQEVTSLLQQLERHYLSNNDPRLRFALLTDYADAPQKETPEDGALLEQAVEGVRALNEKYGYSGFRPFYLFHRERRWNPREACWMGWERKRGKLEEFNRLLRGGNSTSYIVQEGDLGILSRVQFVITLDADTVLPRDSASALVATLAHPLNRAEFDPNTDQVVAGYTVLQPRVEIDPTSSSRSLFARLFSGGAGLDLYTLAVSDVYQDLFGEGIFAGKGIYDVDAFARSLEGRVPDDALLSHDLFEGVHGRAGLVTDIALIEEYPSHYLAHTRRLHRWIRGDWQLLPWLGTSAPGREGRVPNPLSVIDRWKIIDNLRRSLVMPSLLALWTLGWLGLAGSPVFWTLAGLSVVALPLAGETLDETLQGVREGSFSGAGASIATAVQRQLLELAFVPFQAVVAADAIVRTLTRLIFTRRRMLEWTSAAHTIRALADSTAGAVWREMAGAPIIAVALAALVLAVNVNGFVVALPLLLVWMLSPQIAHRISQPLVYAPELLNEQQRRKLQRLARRTWLFFEEFVGPDDHWLPPDHFQQNPRGVAARRTSPTNVGLLLLSMLSAYDLGYLGPTELALRVRYTLDGMDGLEKYRGHLLNWYDTRNLEPLPPRYVSTVDSGNLAAALVAVRQACLEMPSLPAFRWQRWQGLLDTMDLLGEVLERLKGARSQDLATVQASLRALRQKVLAAKEDPSSWVPLLVALYESELPALEKAMAGLLGATGARKPDAETLRDVRTWVERVRNHLTYMRYALSLVLPWSFMLLRPPEWVMQSDTHPDVTRAWQALVDALPVTLRHDEMPTVAQAARERLADLEALLTEDVGSPEEIQSIRTWCVMLRDQLDQAERNTARQMADFERLAERMESYYVAMDFSFLYDYQNEVFHIGYNVDAGQLDEHHYDLLASEARVASLLAISKDEVEQRHWLHLSRPLALFGGQRVLLSWSGTMFEYLMPDLFMRRYDNSLLGQSSRGAVARQIAYCHERRVPWGISESGYYRFDSQMNYQYRAFGVPGLGFDRGLADHLVVSPYASILALSIAPQAVLRNMEELEGLNMLGRYGFYEAVDYTPSRLPVGQRHAIVQSFMAHHQGMILLSLANYLQDDSVVRRFHSDLRVQSADLLLQEQVPLRAPIEGTKPDEARAVRPLRAAEEALASWRASIDSPVPQAHLLSNGRYSVVITSAGTGYSQWKDLELTRWRADTTLDNWGTWIYLRDRDTGALWSATRQPIGPSQEGEEARFSPHTAEFVRREHGVATRTDVAVSLNEDVEIRRVTVTNSGDSLRRLSLCSYGEVVLESAGAEERHPAFSKLFVQSEYLPDLNALLFWRRPRTAEQEPAFLLHLLVIQDAERRVTGAHEAERGRFLGRARDARSPLALTEGGGRLSGTTGTTLDPIMALAQHLDVGPRETARVAYITLAAESRERALELARQYRSWPAIDRVFEHDGTRLSGELRELGLDASEMESVQQLFSALLYPHPALRADRETLASNTQGQPRLWPYAISGDYPMLLVRVKDPADTGVVQQALLAHSYWRKRQQMVDLVILNERDAGYALELHNQLLRLVNRTGGDAWLDARGGIFLLRRDRMAPEDRTVLETTARIVLDGKKGSLADQLAPLRAMPLRLPALAPTRPVPDDADKTPPLERPLDLLYDNGLGGFAPDGREYVIYLEPGHTSPAPWINVVANETFGFLVSESGGGYTWAVNSGENRLTPWSNDPVSDPPGEALYLRDEETGEVWTPTPLPGPARAPYRIRHGAGYSVFEHHSHELAQALRLYVAPDAPVKIVELRLRNTSDRHRRVTATYYAEWVLYTLRDATQMYVIPEYDAETRALLARNPYNAEFGERVAFLAGSKAPHGLTADRAEFLGRMGRRSRPAALTRVGLEGRVEAGADPCAALQLHVDLAPGETEVVYFLLGQGDDRQHARDLVRRFQDPGQVAAAREATLKEWDRLLGAVQVQTPDPAMDVMLNRWLLYQALSSRIWGRSAFYQSSGAYGFRDQLQDVMSLSHVAPEAMKEQIVRAAAHQFEEGDVLHWWHPPSGRGVRTRFSDDLLWLPYVTAHYIETTQDSSILQETAPFLQGEPLAPDEEDRYGHYQPSEQEHSIYEHCVRAIERGSTKGPHGIPLIGGGDWNDGMDRVGIGGRGESVWLGWFLYSVLDRFALICERQGDAKRAETYRRRAVELREAMEAHAWDGAWYRRAFYDDGTALGSEQNKECKIDAIAQSWAVLSGAGQPDRALEAMHSVSRTLVRPDERLVLLFTPPFDKTPRDPGYIKGYPPGIRENGGQYTHAAIWTVWAYAALGQGDYAGMLFRMMNPVYHSDTRAKSERYRVEPYVVAADIYSVPPHVGRGGWTWYTGSAGWFYRLGIEAILGLRREGDMLRVDPSIPKSWPGFQVTYRNNGTTYRIQVANPRGIARGVQEVTLNGETLPDKLIPLACDGATYEVTVTLGDSAGQT